MSVKLRRYHANESNFNKGGRLRTEIQVPASAGVTDLTSSKVVLDMHMVVQEGSTDVPLPVTFGNQQMVGGAQALIRNAAVISQTSGLLNERRNQNVLSANLDWYQVSRAQEDQRSLFGNSTNTNYGVDRMNLLPDNPFIVWKKPSALSGAAATVTEAAVTRRAEIPVAWKHIDNFASMSSFPNMAVGDLTYRVEFEDQMNVAFPARMPFSAGEPCDNRSAVGSLLGAVGAPLTLTKTTGNYFRVPQQGDIACAYFIQSTTGSGSYKYPAASGANSSGLDEIESVTTAGGKYVVTLKNGFTTTAAAEACTGITLFYCAASEMLGNSVFPLPLDAAMTGDTGGIYGNAAAPITFSLNAVGGIQTSQYDDSVTLDSLNTIPWYVGAPVTFTGVDTSGGGAIVKHETTIASVIVDTTDVKITLTTPYDGTANTLAQCSLTYRDSLAGTKFTCNWVVDEVYAELFQLQLTPQQMAKAKTSMADMELSWVDQQLIQRNMPDGATAHTEVLQALANTIGLAVITPQNLTLLSGFDGCSRYRFAINGKEVTNQDIIVGGADTRARQIHNYMLKSFFGNLGQALKKYDSPQYDYVCRADKATHAIYPLIIPNLPQESVVQIQMFSDSTMAGKNIYYCFFRQRMLKISNGRVQLSA